jgi:hypothetical protein
MFDEDRQFEACGEDMELWAARQEAGRMADQEAAAQDEAEAMWAEERQRLGLISLGVIRLRAQPSPQDDLPF